MNTVANLPSASTVLDPVLDEEEKKEKEVDGSGPRIRCPLCGWSPRKGDHWFCSCGYEWNTFRHGRNLSGVSSSLDFDSVSVVRWLVVAF
jgi:hypothetical protein